MGLNPTRIRSRNLVGRACQIRRCGLTQRRSPRGTMHTPTGRPPCPNARRAADLKHGRHSPRKTRPRDVTEFGSEFTRFIWPRTPNGAVCPKFGQWNEFNPLIVKHSKFFSGTRSSGSFCSPNCPTPPELFPMDIEIGRSAWHLYWWLLFEQ